MTPHVIVLIIISSMEVVTAEYCLCIPFWQCKEEDSNFDIIDEMSLRRRITSDKFKSCSGFFDVCCKIRCGVRGSDNLDMEGLNNLRKRISGEGIEAKFAEFPWMLGILRQNSYQCGASLIHPKVALTAAHCVQIKDQYRVRAGEYNWEHVKEPLKHQDRAVRKIVFHPEYDPLSLKNDIAVLILNRAFQISDNVGFICLPSRNLFVSNNDCIVSGWGKTSYNKNKYQSVLKVVDLPIVDRDICERDLQDALLGPDFFLHDSFMCAGGTFKDACKGDGGSPLICPINNKEEGRYQQIGVVSWGLTCGVRNMPGVYTNVVLFVDWIDNVMHKYHLDPNIYKY